MINALLKNMVKLLQTELTEVVPASHFSRAPLAQVQPSALPAIALYPGPLTLVQEALRPIDNAQSQREFQQEFWVEIASTDAEEAEKLASLIMGIFTLSQSNLLEPYQRSETEPEAETHIYSSVNFGTNHRLRQLHLLEGLPTSEAGHYQWTLKGLVTGCLVMVQRQAESEARIQRVIVSSTTHTAPMP